MTDLNSKRKFTCEDIISLQKGVPNCTLMVEGYNSTKQSVFYFCVCDPDCQELICETCARTCHKSHWKGREFQELSFEKCSAICHCGQRNHTMTQNDNEKDFQYTPQCLFLDWSITSKCYIYYENHENTSVYCMFCYNICKAKPCNYIKKTGTEQHLTTLLCECRHDSYHGTHETIRKMLMNSIVFSFERFSIRRFTQMLLLSCESFKNAFHNIIDSITKIALNVDKASFSFEPYCNNKFFIKGLDTIYALVINCKDLYYYSNDLSETFSNMISIIVKKCNNKSSPAVWSLKRNLFCLYHRIQFRSEFEELPILRNDDIINLNPFQRLMYCDYAQKFTHRKYLDVYDNSTDKKSYVNDLLRVIDKYKNVKDKNEHTYEILKKVYSQLKKIIRFNQISKEECAKFFKLNDEIIYNSINQRSDSKYQQIKMLNQMVQCVLYLAYYYNDQIFKEYVFNNAMPLAKTAFFHRDNEFAQMLYKNTTHILLYSSAIQMDRENIQKQFLSTSSRPIHYTKLNDNSKSLVKICFEVMCIACKITSLTLNFPDGYMKGLSLTLNDTCDNYIKAINNELDEHDRIILNRLEIQNKKLNDTYRNFFRFEYGRDETEKKVIDVIQEIFNMLERNDYTPPNYVKKLKNFTVQHVKKMRMKTMKGALLLNKSKTGSELDRIKKEKFIRILLNKHPIVFNIIKSFKIILCNQPAKEEPEHTHFLMTSYLEHIYKFLSYYITDSPDNCIMILTEKNLEAFALLPQNQFSKLINFFIICFKTIKKGKISLVEAAKVLRFIKDISNKISDRADTVELLSDLLRLIKQVMRIDFVSKEQIITKMQKLMKHIFQANPILGSFRDALTPGKNKEDFKTLNQMVEGNVLIKDYPILVLCHLFKNFLKIINFLFADNSTLNESEFLTQILTKKHIPNIISDLTLYLPLRIEILRFYRIAYLDIIINTHKLPSYVNIIISDREKNMDDNTQIFLFYQNLIEIKEKHLGMTIDSCILTFELKHFPKIIEKIVSKTKLHEYFLEGVIQPLHVFLNKYMSIIYNLNGNQYIKLYEIILYFLELKLYLSIQGNNQKKQQKGSAFNFSNIVVNYLELDKNKFNLIYEEGEEVINSLKADIERLKSDDFEILNYKLVYSYFEKHVAGFIKLPKSDFLKDLFSKKTVIYKPERIKEIEKDYKMNGKLNTVYEQRCFDLIHKYENDKHDFEGTSLYHNLGEKNILYDATYRSILLRPMFYLVNSTRLYLKSRRQNLWHIFRLLQYDTGGTQEDILSIYHNDKLKKNEKPIINLNYLSNLFVKNFLSLIFSSCNPNATSTNEDYTISYMIIKIFKYMCEDHNTKFQTIFFAEIEIDYEGKDGHTHHLNMFELMMATLNKVTLLSKWNLVDFGQDEDSISYFYEIFFVMIEFAIEMIQGTTKANLERIISMKGKENELSFFYKFLTSIKSILTNNNNDSEIVYNVRLDIINFIVAFLEEKKTPEKLINLISNLLNPLTIFNSIVNTLKKLYLKEKEMDVSKYESEEFDNKKCKFFISKYFVNSEFSQCKEFELANRMYNYVKLLTNFNNKDAKLLIDSINLYREDELAELFAHQKEVNDDEKVMIGHEFYENYYAVKFFETITKTVWIQGEESKPQMVLFTLDPTVIFLSENTKNNFQRTVPRDNRSSKLFALMEYCNYFFMEINHNKKRIEGDSFLKILNKLNYRILEDLLFLITAIINIIIFLKAQNAESENDYLKTYNIVYPIGIVAVILNLTFLVFWIISKFSLYYVIEKEKYYIRSRKDKEEALSFLESIQIMIVNTMLTKQEIISFLWNIIFSTAGSASSKNIFLFSIQLLIMVNLSPTLQNIVKAITMRYQQLLTTILFLFVAIYIFGCLAFYFLSQNFVHTLEGNQENACGSLFYCFLTHMNFGLRTDGGIGEFISKTSFIDNPSYFMGMFFFQLIFFILIIIIVLAVIGGSIIDTFAELREKTQEDSNDFNNICFICNGDRNAIEKLGENFEDHITKTHNIWTYVDYIIGLKFVDPQETNAINSFVIEKLEEKKISWFPSFTQNEEDQSDDEEIEG